MYYERTPGVWTYIDGEPGFMGSLEEPPMEPYPPTVVASTDRGDIELAQLVMPYPDDAVYDPESGEREVLGDYAANGILMAAAPVLKTQVHNLIAATHLHIRNTGTAPTTVLSAVLDQAQNLLDALEKK